MMTPLLSPYSKGCCQDRLVSIPYSRDLCPCVIPDTRVFTSSHFIMSCFLTTFYSTHCTTKARTWVFLLICLKTINSVCVSFQNPLPWAIYQGLGTNMTISEHFSNSPFRKCIAPEEAPIAEVKYSVIFPSVQCFVTVNFYSTQSDLFPTVNFLYISSCLPITGVHWIFTFPSEIV